MAGKFINFDLPFMQNGQLVSSNSQAISILNKAQQLIAAGAPGVAITYSANYDQTQEIAKVYAAGGWDTHTSGGNQAEVMYYMENLMGNTYSALQYQMRIAPITTMTYGAIPDWDTNEAEQTKVITSDLNNIETLLKNGWYVLGWQNQKTIGTSSPYAVGGGFATHLFPSVIALIQSTLEGFANTYQ